MLSESQIAVSQLHQLLFFYMYPLPLKWNKEYDKLVFEKLHQLIPWGIDYIFILSYIFFCFFDVVLINYCPIPGRHVRVDTIVQVLAGSLSIAYCAVIYAGLTNLSCVSGFNGLIRLVYDNNDEVRGSEDNLITTWVMLCVIASSLSGFFFALVLVAIEYDTFYFILEQILPPPMYRTRDTIIGSVLLRFVLILPGVTEISRSLSYVLTLFMVLLDSATKVAKRMTERLQDNPVEFHKVYVQLCLLYGMGKQYVHKVVWMALTGTFWTLVIFTWICIKGWHHLPPVIRNMFAVVTFLLVLFHVIMLPKAIQALITISNFADTGKKLAKKLYVRTHTRESRILVRQTRAVLPIKVSYGLFWTIDRDFLMDYLYLVTLRTFDALLILDF
ncbi:unnamed protein product [Orchesella dallaii]|uniref:Gustatory receptor n=1 Tax=Orchesella dallaii TaxID=48710 RepID=A0ABP1S8J2_9HEXA